MDQTKYFNDAVIGNKNMVVSFSKTGEMLRLLYPNVDFRQFIDFYYVGIRINDSGLIYLHNDINNIYKQEYVEDTNVLKTEIWNSYFKLRTIQTDFVMMKEDVLIKRYEFINESTMDLDLNFLIYSGLITNENNSVSGYHKSDSLLQYTYDYNLATFSKHKISATQINNTKENVSDGVIGDKDYIGMSEDSSLSYELGIIKPKEKKQIDIYVYPKKNDDNYSIYEIEENIERIKKIDTKKELENTIRYWRRYLKEHKTLHIKELENGYYERVQEIYERTILLYPLLTNHNSGGISAGVEVDEHKTKCGRYAYCWPRDGIFITRAMDILGMGKEVEKFYKAFCKNTQNKTGLWEQRFYTDGHLAPCWGYQIDETASVVYGVFKHYQVSKDEKFLKDNLKMCEKAIKALTEYAEKIVTKAEEQPQLSYDLWEENEGVHAYSLAAIFASFDVIIQIWEALKRSFESNRIKLEKMRTDTEKLKKLMLEIKEYINKELYDDSKKSFIRNVDGKMDISLLGLVTPFNVFTVNEKKVLNTIERMELTLRTYTGGYLRYEGDNYLQGNNPWIISNLWLADYYLEKGEDKKAKECFDFVVATSTETGYLGEQVSNKTMKPAWVIGLGWSHAMYIIILEKLLKKGII